MKKFLLALGAFSFIGQSAIAQEKVITGIVVSSEDGLPMTGVAIMDKQSNNGVMTDLDSPQSAPAMTAQSPPDRASHSPLSSGTHPQISSSSASQSHNRRRT